MSDEDRLGKELPDPAAWPLPHPDEGLIFTGIKLMADMLDMSPEEAARKAEHIDEAFALLFHLSKTERIRDEIEHALSVRVLGSAFAWWRRVKPYILHAVSASLRASGE